MLTVLVFLHAVSAVPSSAESLFTRAEQEERDLDLAGALDDYEASIALDPSNRYALRASARARWLRARSEGGFAPLERLERTRRDSAAQRNGATVDALAQDLEAFPRGQVQAEARMFVAEAYGTRLERPSDAERELARLLESGAGDAPLRAQAATRLADMAMTRGDVATAQSAARDVAGIDPGLGARVARWRRRRVLEKLAASVLGLFSLVAVVAAARHPRALGELRTFAPRAFAACAYLALAAAVLADAYEQGHATPFLAFPAALFLIALLGRAWALAGASSRAARVSRALLGVLAVVASAFLVLDRADVRYLESFGL